MTGTWASINIGMGAHTRRAYFLLEEVLGSGLSTRRRTNPINPAITEYEWVGEIVEELRLNNPGLLMKNPQNLQVLYQRLSDSGLRWAAHTGGPGICIMFLDPRDAVRFKLTWGGKS